MRHLLRPWFLSIALAFTATAATSTAWADDPRIEAKSHYQSGVKLYASGDYRGAIKEFSAAQQLAPADLNNYNLALCYDKLGEADTAIQYYRAYLDRVPGTDRRAEIEASIARLDAAVKSASAKKQQAEEARKAEEARRADEERKAAEAAAAKKAADDAAAKQAADEAAKKAAADAAAKKAADDAAAARQPPPPPNGGAIGPVVGGVIGGSIGGGSTGTPGTGEGVSTGDAQLDRVQQIDISRIRDQRLGGAGSGLPANVNAPGGPRGGAGANLNASIDGRAANANLPPANPGQPQGPMDQKPAAEKPLYKKWWFWAIVGVSALVVYEIATSDSTSAQPGRTARETLPLGPVGASSQPGGLTLMRF